MSDDNVKSLLRPLVNFAGWFYPWLVACDLLLCGTLFVRFLLGGSDGVTQALLHAARAEYADDGQRILGYYLLAFALLLALTISMSALMHLSNRGRTQN